MAEYKLSLTAEEIDEKLKNMGNGGGLPVMEFTTPFDEFGGYQTLTAEESAQLNVLASAGIPFIAKIPKPEQGQIVGSYSTVMSITQSGNSAWCNGIGGWDGVKIEKHSDGTWRFFADSGE